MRQARKAFSLALAQREFLLIDLILIMATVGPALPQGSWQPCHKGQMALFPPPVHLTGRLTTPLLPLHREGGAVVPKVRALCLRPPISLPGPQPWPGEPLYPVW